MLLNLIKHQQLDIDKIYLYVKDPLELNCQLLINGRGKVEMKELEIQKHSLIIDKQSMMFMKTLKNRIQQRTKVLIVFDEVIADIETNKKVSSIITELFLSGIKLNISFICLSQSYFKLAKTLKLNATHHFIMKIPKESELQQIIRSIKPSNYSSDINFNY